MISFNIKKIAKFALVSGLIISSAFLITGCQAKTSTQSDSVNNNVAQKGFSFFHIGNSNAVSTLSSNEKDLNSIKAFFDFTVTLAKDKEVKLTEGVSFPIILNGLYYVYTNPSVSFNYGAGTSITGNTATITYKFGYTTSLSVNPEQGSVTVNLAQLVPDKDGNYKVSPSIVNQILANLKVANDVKTLLSANLMAYICYPVYKEQEFKLKVPPKNQLTAVEQGSATLVPDNGEISFKVDYTGQPQEDYYFYILTISPIFKEEITLNPEGNSWTSLASSDMSSCGGVKPASEGGVFPFYFQILAENTNLNIQCNPQSTLGPNIYDMKIIKDSSIICKVSIPRDDVEKEVTFKIKTAYTIVKKDTISDLKILFFSNQ
ncbi:MAG: hypothetical protein ABGW69_01360 [Nanoarchaeota archaeon]